MVGGDPEASEGVLSMMKRAFVGLTTKAFRVITHGQTAGGAFTATAVDADGHVQVDVLSGGGAGTEYTEGTDTVAAGEGTLALAENTGGVGTSLKLNAAEDLKVSLDSEVVSVDATGQGNVPVSGTVDLGATDNAVLDSIAANTANLEKCIIQDDAPFTPATGHLMMIGGEYDDAGVDSVDEGDAGSIRISANRNAYVQIRDAAGNERGLNVDASGDIGVTSADLSTLAGAVSGSEVQVDVVGALPAGSNAIGKLAANSGVDIGDVDVLSLPAIDEESSTPTNINTTYNNTTTTATSAAIDVHAYRSGTLSFTLSSSSTPTTIRFEVLVSCDEGSNYAKLMNGPVGSWVYDDTICSSAISRAVTFPVCADFIQIKVTATGTDATKTFTVSNARLKLRE